MADVSPAGNPPWLTIIGIGEDGPEGLGEEARRLIAGAPAVFGGARHHALAAPLISGETFAWQSPFERSIEAVLARRGTPVVVLASGDPFLYGVGATLSRHVAAEEMRTIPAPSAFSLAASRLGWPLQDVAAISLHGRPIDLIRPHLHPGRRIVALTSDENGPRALANLLATDGFGQSQLTVLEALGGARERRRNAIAADFDLTDIDSLNVCALQIAAGEGARILPFAAGLEDGLFEHDGQITKREIRAMTVSALAPRHGQLLWDIGAGSGSIGIEWMLAEPSLKTIALEQSSERAARIARNASAFGVPHLAVVEGAAPGALAGLPEPDAIFIGGGGSEPNVIDAATAALKRGGRLVANAVTLEMEAVLLSEHAKRGGSLTRIEIARAGAIGGMSGWRPAMPVTQWCWTKG
ncbi:precorrin-6Y C5,15-methyltransferase (decarboxylating) (plasmid) [Rhizobium phaseoli]|uniref:Precorrin-6Y C5,15-methyltransferase (Decarboxylating) protein n=1 Tax=Rhizobium etli (strain CIAT 652) TaxID=491916 RepID=B3Q211_RHIE6|nr:bifunctional cobalt-precorrin-7 (C(5))-methyltransferase/cobalt-precorrin-6B (C(15))-methyltransferase [Rhizobium phaseoli]ACE93717.1 precorrin-6Y C5,15-methyltransferase (decarboxylating) protein [Rhizobium etli CIAT 652]ANL75027.1 precorrin-6Y C5,15-methyltransferase (decarboxylating) [Rhizobium phaseoli]PCD67515.1 bifunctional cobalt-precorrin-7 (C(5))-methyltransferase/cobalt-precorrin-6B (C(15))-methyltransferase [Rhizobium phaseoli]